MGRGWVWLLLLSACGGASSPQSAEHLIDETTAGKQRCVSEGDEHKLFVVEWDGTDASSFQAHASRDVVFVRYHECEMQVLTGCNDGSLAGRYGSYREPIFTSGNLESFMVETQDELAVRLPLGVLSLGGELSNERALELSYFVSGTVLASRDEFHRADIADKPRCQGATHVVVAYNLGAYVLNRRDKTQIGADVGLSEARAGAAHREKREALRRAGSMDACAKVDNHPCRAPIRLTLRPLRDGASTPAAPAPVTADAGDAALATAQGQMNAVGYEQSAQTKLMAHDGAGCLADLDLADRTDPAGRVRRLDQRARCEMRSGKCEQGKEHYREARKAWHRQYDKTGLANDASIEHEVEQMAKAECATKAGGGKSAQNNALELMQAIVQASGRGDAATCVEKGQALDRAVGEGDEVAKRMAAGGLQQAAKCAAAGGRCTDAEKLYRAFMRHFDPSFSAAMVASAFAQNVPECAKR
jgi:hypothetical protein